MQKITDPQTEALCIEWIQSVTQLQKPAAASFAAWLKSGTVLCTLVNAIRPAAISGKFSTSAKPFAQRENIAAYLKACQSKAKVRDSDLFMTDDLFDEKNLNSVLTNLCALGEAARLSGFKGAQLSVGKGQLKAAPTVAPRHAPTITPSQDPATHLGSDAQSPPGAGANQASHALPAARSTQIPFSPQQVELQKQSQSRPSDSKPNAASASRASATSPSSGAVGLAGASQLCGKCGEKRQAND